MAPIIESRALELAPGNATVLRSAGMLVRGMGRLDEDLRSRHADPRWDAFLRKLGLAA